jgi:hypothetical protein
MGEHDSSPNAADRQVRQFTGSAWLLIPLMAMVVVALWVADVPAVCALPMAFPRSSDTALAIYNTSVLLGAASHFVGVAVTSRRAIRLARPATWLTATYAMGTAAMGLTIWGAFAHRLPVFFIDGQGGTPLRTPVISATVALFVVTAVVHWQTNRRSASPFSFWYALGLGLLATGLTGSMAITVTDSPLQWVARLTRVFGTVYMCVAVQAAARASGQRVIRLAAVEESWRATDFLAGLREQLATTPASR